MQQVETQTPLRRQMYAYARSMAAQHVDPITGELNCTTLGEDIADQFDIDWQTDDTPWEIAFVVSQSSDPAGK